MVEAVMDGVVDGAVVVDGVAADGVAADGITDGVMVGVNITGFFCFELNYVFVVILGRRWW
jgi:hypothetical protein